MFSGSTAGVAWECHIAFVPLCYNVSRFILDALTTEGIHQFMIWCVMSVLLN